MKYTIPYDDKITLPHIKRINNIGINANDINYDKKELNGEVVIVGEYILDNSKDIMEFKHEIPVSFLIDDEEASPQINISNFKYELIPGRGIEVMFDLDVILQEEKVLEPSRDEVIDQTLEETTKKIEEGIKPSKKANKKERAKTEDDEVKEFQTKIDENLDAVLNKGKNKRDKKSEEKEDLKLIEEVKEEEVEDEVVVEEQQEQEAVRHDRDKTKKQIIEEEIIEDVVEEITEGAVEGVIFEEEIDLPVVSEELVKTNICSTATTFDSAFIPRSNDRFTTYKVLLLDEDEEIDFVLESRNLSRALICNEYTTDKKIILKIEND